MRSPTPLCGWDFIDFTLSRVENFWKEIKNDWGIYGGRFQGYRTSVEVVHCSR